MSSLFILTGPSGVGKTTLANLVLAEMPRLKKMVTATTRAPRPEEKNGREYYFLTESDFIAKIKAGDFFEHAEVYGHHYGNDRGELERLLRAGHQVLLILDIQGAKTVKKLFPDAKIIFLTPDNPTVLASRLARRPQKEKNLAERLANAVKEMNEAKTCDYTVINHDGQPEIAVAAIKTILGNSAKSPPVPPPRS